MAEGVAQLAQVVQFQQHQQDRIAAGFRPFQRQPQAFFQQFLVGQARQGIVVQQVPELQAIARAAGIVEDRSHVAGGLAVGLGQPAQGQRDGDAGAVAAHVGPVGFRALAGDHFGIGMQADDVAHRRRSQLALAQRQFGRVVKGVETQLADQLAGGIARDALVGGIHHGEHAMRIAHEYAAGSRLHRQLIGGGGQLLGGPRRRGARIVVHGLIPPRPGHSAVPVPPARHLLNHKRPGRGRR